MRSRFPLLVAIFTISIVTLPHLAHAGGIPFFGPIVPSSGSTCAGGWAMLIIVVNNIISFLLTMAIVFVAPLMIAYAGFLFVTNPMNPGQHQKAKDVLTNTIVGIIIALSAWLIVDAIMAVLYNQNTNSASGGVWGTWTSLISPNGGEFCIDGGGPSSTPTGSVPTQTPANSTVVPIQNGS